MPVTASASCAAARCPAPCGPSTRASERRRAWKVRCVERASQRRCRRRLTLLPEPSLTSAAHSIRSLLFCLTATLLTPGGDRVRRGVDYGRHCRIVQGFGFLPGANPNFAQQTAARLTTPRAQVHART